jgi:adenosylmethionine---8-amino-7-oxononanoate aminotransferase
MTPEARHRESADLVERDQRHLWHPYSSTRDPLPVYPVVSASGVRLRLADGRELIDGMASWWAAIHGYAHPVLDSAVREQLGRMAHVMFGGLTHPPAIRLAELLVEITPEPLQRVFLCDSGSVAVEVAMKMAVQYWQACGRPSRRKMLTVRGGYHGDTTGAMSVCDPVTGMHSVFGEVVAHQFFAPRPQPTYDEPCTNNDVAELAALLDAHGDEVAAVIIEPIVQGAGGMRFYAPDYLRRLRTLCDDHDILLIADEIATGFGRTGKLFGCDHAAIAPDIMCLGKALTGGYVSMAATLTTDKVASGISSGNPGVLLHGPTFTGNPLAAAVSIASIELLLGSPWKATVATLADRLRKGLAPAKALPGVTDVRVLGGIGVIETREPADMRRIQPLLVELGVWVRPFGRLVYVLPPYLIDEADTTRLTAAMVEAVAATTAG